MCIRPTADVSDTGVTWCAGIHRLHYLPLCAHLTYSHLTMFKLNKQQPDAVLRIGSVGIKSRDNA